MTRRIKELKTTETYKRNLYELYTNYIDSSSIISEHYLKKQFYGRQQKYIHKLTHWMQSTQQVNKPLVFKTQPGIGAKTILVNWEKQIRQAYANKKQKVLVIMHFASAGSNNANYFYSLYRIIIKLKSALKLKQNVDLLQQKIRKFFSYWLDICNAQLQRQLIIYCADEIYQKIVIVIEGVDKFIDIETGKQANIAFWLPEKFPKHVKVIVTAAANSDALEHLEKQKCEIVPIELSNQILDSMMTKVTTKQTILNKDTQNNLQNILKSLKVKLSSKSCIYTFIETFSNFLLIDKQNKSKQVITILKDMIEKKLCLQKLQKVQSIQDLYKLMLDLWNNTLNFKIKVELVLKYLILTQKGLTIKQILNLTKISEKQWKCLQAVLSSLLINHNSLYLIKQTTITQFIQQIQHNNIQSHQKIALALQSTSNSIRKLQEQTYHLFVAKSYFKLKEIISNIENFLLLFNPNNKYELSRYWQKLEEKGFDPVIEYNKAIEGFSMHYHPSDQNIFRIIVQISRFLKQFCDFQTYQTPNFRHPYIEGNKSEMQKIGLLKQLNDLQIYVDNSFGDQIQIDQLSIQQQIQQLRQKYFPKDQNCYNSSISQTQQLANQLASKVKHRQKTQLKILSDIQQLNVDVPMNRQKFRNHYLQSLQQFMKKQEVYINGENQNYLDVDQEQNAFPNAQQSITYSFNKVRENYRLRQIKPSLYYYKRWIWIQFPWVCISLNNNYSITPELCQKPDADDSDIFEQQVRYTKQALYIAIDAKQRKKQMFSPKGGDQSSTGSRFRVTYGSSLCKDPKSLTLNGFRNPNKLSNVPDLSLNALTKQLEIKKKQLQISDDHFIVESGISCEEDMKFITMRKKFQQPLIQGVPSNEILPKLKWMIKQHTNYEISYLKSHIEDKKKKLNVIIYDNKKLGQIYKELKMKEQLNKKKLNEHQGEKNVRKNKVLEDLEKKKQDVITNFCKSLLQKQRLKIILKLCSENKTRNEQYLASLNFLLQNLKKMINWEKQSMKSITQQIQQMKAIQERKETIEKQKQKNQHLVERQAENFISEKNKLQKQIQNITHMIVDDIRDQKDRLANSLSGHIKNREQKNIAIMQEKKTKQLEQKLQKVQKDYKSLQNLFQFEDFNFEASEKFKYLLEENQKNKKLKIAYFQRKNKLQTVMRQYERLKQQSQKMNDNSDTDKQKPILKKQTNIVQDQTDIKLKIFLDNISLKLGVHNRQDIIPTLRKKMQELKQNNKEKFSQIMNMPSVPSNNKIQLIR